MASVEATTAMKDEQVINRYLEELRVMLAQTREIEREIILKMDAWKRIRLKLLEAEGF